ncbi:glycosyl hydrolase family 32 [Xylocopilactobacillus apicola]|uniref:beta-fructofuranosidase n=1 Tax=Xylocopilactobacillus apicola TaxID=2932184 RepID=A0AAU9DU32_9LACO|nr:glycosyl hydrolase family 32 [Xylocopilactobacillus apicola]BDR58973.1 beta-fructofuranosidase [Xylocopilactobacillus apicola]
MPFFNQKDGLFYLYYQKDTRNPVPFGDPFGWQLVTTKDFINYTNYGEVLPKGSDDDQDQFVYAGSVFLNANHDLVAYYTGYNRNFVNKEKPSQVLMQAVSSDGIKWNKLGIVNSLLPQKGYDGDDWRDPNVIWDEKNQEYLLILGTRLKGNKKLKTGRIVYFTSHDCQNWNFQGDFFAPDMYTMMEMPQLVRIGAWWYLIYSEYDYKKTTHYCYSRELNGNWIIPRDDTFNGRAYYAARCCGDDKRKYLFGWVPSKEAGKDINNYLWGGTFLPLEIYPAPDGVLQTKLVDSILETVESKITVSDLKINSLSKRQEIIVQKKLKNNYLFSMDFLFEKDYGQLGVIFFENEATFEGYEFNISMSDQAISIERTPNLRWFQMQNIGLTRQKKLKTDRWYHLNLLVDDTIAVLDIEGTVLSCRIEKNISHLLSISVYNSVCKVK